MLTTSGATGTGAGAIGTVNGSAGVVRAGAVGGAEAITSALLGVDVVSEPFSRFHSDFWPFDLLAVSPQSLGVNLLLGINYPPVG